MKEEYLQMKILLERFFEGQTTNEEEQTLYRFFDRDDVPQELLQYKPVMKYFESGLNDEMRINELPKLTDDTNELPESATMVLRHPASKVQSSNRKRWIVWCGVAASFLLVLFSSIYLLTANDYLDPYAGSYIIRNGVRITDLDQIRPELEAAIQKSLLLEQEADQLIERLSSIDNSQEEQIMQELQNHNQRILDNTPDENIRNEIEEFFNPK